MCITPFWLTRPDGGVELVACNRCRRCKFNRVNDLVGRCIAEAECSDGVLLATLTYDNAKLAPVGRLVSSVVLRYEDFQRFMKRLRRAGYRVRYLVVGEFGSRKGRTHWHAVLFFRGRVPDVPMDQRHDWPIWPWGHTHFRRAEYGAYFYVLKYVLKEAQSEWGVSMVARSTLPPLGHEWFMRRAERHVETWLSPQDASYSFGSIFGLDGRRREFWLKGRMRELYVERFRELWRERRGGEPPASVFLSDVDDRAARREVPEFDQREWKDWLRDRPLYEFRQAFWLAGDVRLVPDVDMRFRQLLDGSWVAGWYDSGAVWRVLHLQDLAAVNRVLEAMGSAERLSPRVLIPRGELESGGLERAESAVAAWARSRRAAERAEDCGFRRHRAGEGEPAP